MMDNIIRDIFNTDNYIFFDLETNGLLDKSKKGPQATKIWCAGWWHPSFGSEVKTTTDYNVIIRILSDADYIFCHNGILYDSFIVKRFCGVDISKKIVDTLALSWYLHPQRLLHGLDSWGRDLGINKPFIEDWNTQAIETYLDRVVEDVKIQSKLSFKMIRDLYGLYDSSATRALEMTLFLNSILLTFFDQRENPFDLDIPQTQENLKKLNDIKDIKIAALKSVMPRVPITKNKLYPINPYNKNGEMSINLIKWFELLRSLDAPSDLKQVKYICGYEDPNPNSHTQVKDWLLSLGWIPEIFITNDSKKSDNKKVPQIRDKNKNLCSSVLRIAKDNPDVMQLEQLSVVNHRISVLEGLLKNVDDKGTIFGSIQGFTNTLRSKHSIIVNLPKRSSDFGELIRPVLRVGKYSGEVLVGADIVSLENFTRTCLIAEINPKAIDELLDKDFDTHLDLGISSGMLTQEDSDLYKDIKHRQEVSPETISEEELKSYAKINSLRDMFKTINYSCLYNVGADTLSKSIGSTLYFANKLRDSYWKRNYAVKEKVESAPVKSYLGTNWIYNNIIDVWFETRHDYTKFSSLNQGLGSFIFYSWVNECRNNGIKITLNMHDEIQIRVKKENVDNTKIILQKCMDKVNKMYKLAVPIRISINTGINYGETH